MMINKKLSRISIKVVFLTLGPLGVMVTKRKLHLPMLKLGSRLAKSMCLNLNKPLKKLKERVRMIRNQANIKFGQRSRSEIYLLIWMIHDHNLISKHFIDKELELRMYSLVFQVWIHLLIVAMRFCIKQNFLIQN